MASQIQICNLALTYIGADRITSIADANEQARKLNAVWVPSLKGLLESHPWNFATKRATLALLTETPDHGYANYFQLPSDFLRLIQLDDNDTEYRIEEDKLATDASTVKIEYVFYLTDTSKFSASFTEALAAKLAFELSFSISNNAGLMDRLEKILQHKLSKAIFNDSQQGTPRPLFRNPWIEARV